MIHSSEKLFKDKLVCDSVNRYAAICRAAKGKSDAGPAGTTVSAGKFIIEWGQFPLQYK